MERGANGQGAKYAAITLRGLNHANHWLNSEEGECEEIINLRFKSGSWQEVRDKEAVWQYSHGCSLIHYHPLNDTESSTGDDTTFFYVGYRAGDGSHQDFNYTAILSTYPICQVVFPGGHGFGEVGERVYLLYTEGSASITGLTNGDVYQWDVVSVQILQLVDATVYDAGTGNGHRFTITNNVIAFLPDESYEINILNVGLETVASFSHINNVLLVYTNLMVHFLMWNYDNMVYVELEHPNLPEMSLTEYSTGERFTALSYSEINDENQEEFDYPQHYSQVYDFIANSRKNNNYVESYVMVIVAYRLFDGSFIMHSQPLMTYIGAQIAYKTFHVPVQLNSWDKYEYGYYDLYAGKPNLMVDMDIAFKNKLIKWNGVIEGLTVFMSRPVSFYAYPQSESGYTWAVKMYEGYEYDDPPFALDNKWYMPQNTAVENMIDEPVYYRTDEIPFAKLIAEDSISLQIGINSDGIDPNFNYYMPIDSFSHNRSLSNQQYVFNRRLHQGDITTRFGDADAQLFTDKHFELSIDGDGFEATDIPLLDEDEHARDPLTFYYEVTIQTDMGKRYIVENFTPNIFAPAAALQEWRDEQGGRELAYPWEYSGSGSYEQSTSQSGSISENMEPYRPTMMDQAEFAFYIPVMPLISYADPRAVKIRFIAKQSVGIEGVYTTTYYEIADYTLKAHPFLTIAYCTTNYDIIHNDWTDDGDDNHENPEYKGYLHDMIPIPAGHNQVIGRWDLNMSIYAETTLATDNRYYIDENRLQVSRIDNPFVNEAKHSYQIGGQDSKILGLATSAVQVSEGQYGEFPLFVFTNEGVYTLRQGVDPTILYSSISPVSKERLIAGTLCEINDGIVYATLDGVKLLSGTQIKNISQQVLNPGYNNLINSAGYQGLLDGTQMPKISLYTLLDSGSFKSYLDGAKIAYDSYNSEIIVCNPDYLYSYVYALKYNMWSKIDQVWDYFLQIHPKWMGVKDDELFDMESEYSAAYYFKDFLVQTKPLKLDGHGFKNITRLVLRQLMHIMDQDTYEEGGSFSGFEYPMALSTIHIGDKVEGVYLFGSVDGDEWKLLRGVNVTLENTDPILRVVVQGSNVAIRYIVILICGTYMCYDLFDVSLRLSHLEISYMDKMHTKLR